MIKLFYPIHVCREPRGSQPDWPADVLDKQAQLAQLESNPVALEHRKDEAFQTMCKVSIFHWKEWVPSGILFLLIHSWVCK